MPDVLREIEEAREPADTARMAHSLLALTAEEIGTATGADERTVRRWWNNGSSPTRHRRQLDDLRAIAEILSMTMRDEAIGAWLRSRNRYLNYERPLGLLGKGEFDRVREAAAAYVDGAPL